jgi:molybdopterin-guanine dinucleotide biosynthesis protein B
LSAFEGFLINEGEEVMACEANQQPTAKVELKVNGKEIPLNDFVVNFISETIIGMIKPLRGVKDIKTVSVKIEKR